MNDDSSFSDRLTQVEDHLVRDYLARRLSAFPPFYAALAVAIMVLAWFPLFEFEPDHDATRALSADTNRVDIFSVVYLCVFIALLLTATFNKHKESLLIPIGLAVIAALGIVALFTKFGIDQNPDFNDAGHAAVVLLLFTVVLGLAHANGVYRVNRESAADQQSTVDVPQGE